MNISKLVLVFSLLFFASVLLQCSNESILEPADSISNENLSLQKKSLSNNEYIKVFHTDRTITIDGYDKDWVNAPKHKMRQYIDVTGEIDNKFDLSAYFKIIWDDENLYVFASILDDEINTNGGQLFERDGFEIYIDGDNSKNTEDVIPPGYPPFYDLNDDFIRFIPGESDPLSAYGIYDVSNYEFAIQENDDGWTVEIKIPFVDLLDFPAEPGHIFGLEFQVNDNDQNERQNFVKWISPLDESYFRPALFGSAYLFKSNGK